MIFQGNVRHGPTAAYYWAHFGGPDPVCTGYAEELHYKQFTAEIVANFGDKWEITDKEILAWLADKEAFQSQSNNK